MFPPLLPLCHFLRYFPSITPCYFSLPLPVLLLFCHFLCYFPYITSYYISLLFSVLLTLCYFLLLPLCHALCHIPSVTSPLSLPITSPATSCVTSPCHFPLLPLPLPVLLPLRHFLCYFPCHFLLLPLPLPVSSLSFPVTSPCQFLCYLPSTTHQYSHIRSKHSEDTSSWKANKPWFKFRLAQDSFLSTKSSRPAPGLAHPPIQWMPVVLSPALKRLVREVKHSLTHFLLVHR